jgi:hypothetical protein
MVQPQQLLLTVSVRGKSVVPTEASGSSAAIFIIIKCWHLSLLRQWYISVPYWYRMDAPKWL